AEIDATLDGRAGSRVSSGTDLARASSARRGDDGRPRRPIGPPRAAINVTVGEPEEADGATRITQSFLLPHPLASAWALMRDVEQMAPCLPGLVLDGPPQDNFATGRLEAKIGPVTA